MERITRDRISLGRGGPQVSRAGLGWARRWPPSTWPSPRTSSRPSRTPSRRTRWPATATTRLRWPRWTASGA